jgi:hypothetical protein
MSHRGAGRDASGVATTAGVHRRTVARGAAWTAPVVAVSVAAPAFAASTACLSAMWTEAIYSGKNGKWSYVLAFDNCGTATMRVTAIQTFTSYHAPATNTGDKLVDSIATNLLVTATGTTYTSSKHVFQVVPRDATTSLLPGYYNDFPETGDSETNGEILCMDTPRFPSDGHLYPHSCERLLDDQTYLLISYTIGGVQQEPLKLPMSNTVGCRVTAGCSTKVRMSGIELRVVEQTDDSVTWETRPPVHAT